jgi:hypothetical protein
VAALPDDADPDPFVEGIRLGGYRFSLRARDREDLDHEQKGSRSVRLLTSASSPAPRAGVIAAAVSLARDLINMPSGVKTRTGWPPGPPSWPPGPACGYGSGTRRSWPPTSPLT